MVSIAISRLLCSLTTDQLFTLVWTWGARVVRIFADTVIDPSYSPSIACAQGHSWRLTGDASATWSFITSSITQAVYYLAYDDFWGHPDMDMMEIGNGKCRV